MKISRRQLTRIIKEEKSKIVKEFNGRERQYSYAKKLEMVEEAMFALRDAYAYDNANADIDDEELVDLINHIEGYVDALKPMVSMEKHGG